MSSPRARANHALYLAGILIKQWRELLLAQDLPQAAVNAAFDPAVRLHLGHAYGWFLLQLSGEQTSAGEPPSCCEELPPVPEGKMEPGEIAEFRRLEAEGWLHDMLNSASAQPAVQSARSPRRAGGGLSVSEVGESELERAQQWKSRLETIFERMSDSLDEC